LGTFKFTDWKSLIDKVNAKLGTSLAYPKSPDRWSVDDIQKVRDALTNGCSGTQFTVPTVLWKQDIIDEITKAIASCTGSSWTVTLQYALTAAPYSHATSSNVLAWGGVTMCVLHTNTTGTVYTLQRLALIAGPGGVQYRFCMPQVEFNKGAGHTSYQPELIDPSGIILPLHTDEVEDVYTTTKYCTDITPQGYANTGLCWSDARVTPSSNQHVPVVPAPATYIVGSGAFFNASGFKTSQTIAHPNPVPL